jgi:hypothetical protein
LEDRVRNWVGTWHRLSPLFTKLCADGRHLATLW